MLYVYKGPFVENEQVDKYLRGRQYIIADGLVSSKCVVCIDLHYRDVETLKKHGNMVEEYGTVKKDSDEIAHKRWEAAKKQQIHEKWEVEMKRQEEEQRRKLDLKNNYRSCGQGIYVSKKKFDDSTYTVIVDDENPERMYSYEIIELLKDCEARIPEYLTK